MYIQFSSKNSKYVKVYNNTTITALEDIFCINVLKNNYLSFPFLVGLLLFYFKISINYKIDFKITFKWLKIVQTIIGAILIHITKLIKNVIDFIESVIRILKLSVFTKEFTPTNIFYNHETTFVL